MALDYNLEIEDSAQEIKNQIGDIKRRIRFDDIFCQCPTNEYRYSLKKDSIVWNYLMNEKLTPNDFINDKSAGPTHVPISNYAEACLDIKPYYYKEEFDFIIHEFFIRQNSRFIKGKDPVYFIKTDHYLDKNHKYKIVTKTHLSCNLELYDNYYNHFCLEKSSMLKSISKEHVNISITVDEDEDEDDFCKLIL